MSLELFSKSQSRFQARSTRSRDQTIPGHPLKEKDIDEGDNDRVVSFMMNTMNEGLKTVDVSVDAQDTKEDDASYLLVHLEGLE